MQIKIFNECRDNSVRRTDIEENRYKSSKLINYNKLST